MSSIISRFQENVTFGKNRLTSRAWKLVVSACHDSGVNDAATDSTSLPAFGRSTVIVNDESPYARSTAWNAFVSAYAIGPWRDMSFAG